MSDPEYLEIPWFLRRDPIEREEARMKQQSESSEPTGDSTVLLTRCCKCGCDYVEVVWHEHKVPYETPFGKKVPDNEHLACTCNRCGYRWKEKPLDKRKAG